MTPLSCDLFSRDGVLSVLPLGFQMHARHLPALENDKHLDKTPQCQIGAPNLWRRATHAMSAMAAFLNHEELNEWAEAAIAMTALAETGGAVMCSVSR